MQNLSVEDTHFSESQLKINGKLIDLKTPKIMGILNITDDSFYFKSRIESDVQLLKQAEKMLDEGATFLDLGAMSSRPNATQFTNETEKSRIASSVELILKEFPDALISVDTFRADVAQAGIDAGASIINDISGFSFDPKLLEVVARNKVAYILMHLQGNFETMHQVYSYQNVTKEVIQYFHEKIEILLKSGIHSIILDPGFGFSKNLEQNYQLLREMDRIQILERPVLVGISRKSMIYKKLGISAEEALNGTTALNSFALSKGASILRVHDVAPAKEIIDLLYA